MKIWGITPLLARSLIEVFCSALAVAVSAQTFTTLHTFAKTNGPFFGHYTNVDGARPAGLILSGDTLFGTTLGEQTGGDGGIFRLNKDGTDFRRLLTFTGTNGLLPQSRLILDGDTLYGTTEFGGSSNRGSIFALTTNGTAFRNIASFPGFPGGMFPQAGLALSGGTLYGTTRGADPNSPVPVVSQGWGTVFKVNIDGTGYKDLYTFTPLSGTTNRDGVYPVAELLLCKNTLYGTASSGGAYGDGTVFAVNTDGTAFKTLHSFSSSSDGAGPVAGLFLSVDSLYGTTRWGGASGNGIIFALTTNGSTFMIIHSFSATSVVYPYINSDGAYPVGGLTVVGNTLYGTTRGGGLWGNGTLFMVETDGTGFQTVYNFSRSSPDASGDPTNTDGTFPGAGVILSGTVLYGTASAGGSWGLGTVFSVSLPQSLTIVPSGRSIVLSWPINTSSFTLQSTTNLMSPSWSTVPAVPIVINGQNTVTNPLSSTQQFFRLAQ